MPLEKAFEVYIETKEPILQNGSQVHVFWSPETILPLSQLDFDSYTVDITVRELDLYSGEWKELATLASNLTNNGSAKIAFPELESVENSDDLFCPIVIEVGVSSVSMMNSWQKQEISSNIFTKIGEFGLRLLKQAAVRIIKKYIQQPLLQRIGCEVWANTGFSNSAQEINTQLPPCPCTSNLASEPNSGFKEEKLSSVVKVVGTVQEFIGTTIINDGFHQFFHPDTSSCYRQRVTNP